MDRVAGKVALVTGGAMGLGAATTRMLAREGAVIAVSDVNEKAGEALVDEIVSEDRDAIFLKHDVSKEKDWRSVIDMTVRRFGRLDILVNNAGVALSANIEDMSFDQWRALMAANLDGVFLGVKHGIAAMKAQRCGSIINLSSNEGMIGDANLSAYNASKGGVRLLTKSAALHCAKSGYNIRVNSVHPGYIVTPMVETDVAEHVDRGATRSAILNLHPLGHLGEPDDIAYGILYLASDESKFVTGSELVIDGGYTAQ